MKLCATASTITKCITYNDFINLLQDDKIIQIVGGLRLKDNSKLFLVKYSNNSVEYLKIIDYIERCSFDLTKKENQ